MNKQNKITIADLVSVLGVAALWFVTFLGAYFKKGGEMSMPLIRSIIIAVSAGLVCFMAKQCKQTEASNKSGWLYLEIAMLVLYVGMALFGSKYALHFFSVNSDRDALKVMCNDDCDAINAFIDNYVTLAETAKEKVKNKLANPSEEWKNWAKSQGVTLNRNGINTFVDVTLQNELLDDTEVDRVYWKDCVEDVRSSVDHWSLLRVPGAAKDLKEIGEDVSHNLIGRFNRREMPDLALEGDIESTQFYTSIIEGKELTLVGILLTVLIHFLVLFDYLVSPRPGSTRIKKRFEDNAIVLDDEYLK